MNKRADSQGANPPTPKNSGYNVSALAPGEKLHPLEAREIFADRSRPMLIPGVYTRGDAQFVKWKRWQDDVNYLVYIALTSYASMKASERWRTIPDDQRRSDPRLFVRMWTEARVAAGLMGPWPDTPSDAARMLDAATGIAVDWGDIHAVNHALQLVSRTPRDVPAALRLKLQQRVTTERCYYSVKHEDLDTAEKHLVAFSKQVLRFPYRFADYSKHTYVRETGNVGCGLLWHIATGTAMIQERWRKATNIYGYLRRAARGIINDRILEEEGDRIAAVNAGFSWREPVSGSRSPRSPKQWRLLIATNPPQDTESTYDPIGALDRTRLHEALDAANFSEDMRAYLAAKIKDVKLGDMPEYLTNETDKWTRRRVDAARELVRRAAGAALAAWYESADTNPAATPGAAAGLVPTIPGRKDSSARDDDAPSKHAQEGGMPCYSMGSVTHYRQPLWVASPGNGFPWVFAHKYDTGNGVMDRESMEALREVIAEERRALFSG